MNQLRKRITIILGAVAGVSTLVAGVVACSSDGDVTTGGDSGADNFVPPPPVEPPPAPPPNDGGKDVIVVEASTLQEFVKQNAAATCVRYKECCRPGGDGGFDLAKCQTDFGGDGWDQSLHDITKAGGPDAASLTFDPATATDCLTAIRNMTCANTPAAEFKNAWVKCYQAVHGTVAVNSPCVATVQCVSTAYCEADGGTCQPLKAANADCEQVDPSSAQCSYRGAGSTQCLDQGSGPKCGNGLANGGLCNYDWDCQSGGCTATDDAGSSFACGSVVNFLFGICELYDTDGG